jgi:hypothetical protein
MIGSDGSLKRGGMHWAKPYYPTRKATSGDRRTAFGGTSSTLLTRSCNLRGMRYRVQIFLVGRRLLPTDPSPKPVEQPSLDIDADSDDAARAEIRRRMAAHGWTPRTINATPSTHPTRGGFIVYVQQGAAEQLPPYRRV